MQLCRHNLMVLLNGLQNLDTTTITVEHPADEFAPLVRIRLDDDQPTATVQFPTRIDDYERIRDEIRLEHGQRPYDDLPDTNAFVAALTAGGLIEFANQSTVDAYIEDVCYPAVGEGEAPLMVGIDANVFPWGFPQSLDIDHKTGATDDHDRAPTNGYALSNGVVDELHWQFSHYEVDSLVAAFGEEFARLENQPGGSKREGRLGIQQYQQLIASRNVDLVESDPGDEAIIDGYLRYDRNSRKKPFLLSNDAGFIDQAKEGGLHAQRLVFQSTLPRRVKVEWENVAETLFYLTILFGVLVLPKATLYGVWKGKQDIDWQNEAVDIDCRGSQSALRPFVVRHRQIAREYDQLRN